MTIPQPYLAVYVYIILNIVILYCSYSAMGGDIAIIANIISIKMLLVIR